MGGGAGVEYYFGYQLAENDLVCEDWRSRDQSWDYCRIALELFREKPLSETQPADELIGNDKFDNSKYCLAKPGEMYLVYLPKAGSAELDLTKAPGKFSVWWFNPRSGCALQPGSPPDVTGGEKVVIDSGKTDGEDWVAVVVKHGFN